MKAVKERELPPVDDAFAKLASEFDTLAELKTDFVARLERVKKMEQGAQARDRLVEKLLADNEIPVPANDYAGNGAGLANNSPAQPLYAGLSSG